jgi:hypothetical protein
MPTETPNRLLRRVGRRNQKYRSLALNHDRSSSRSTRHPEHTLDNQVSMSMHLMGLFIFFFFSPFSLVRSYELQTRMSVEHSSQHSTLAEKIKLKCLLLSVKWKCGQGYLGNLAVHNDSSGFVSVSDSARVGPIWRSSDGSCIRSTHHRELVHDHGKNCLRDTWRGSWLRVLRSIIILHT